MRYDRMQVRLNTLIGEAFLSVFDRCRGLDTTVGRRRLIVVEAPCFGSVDTEPLQVTAREPFGVG
jgi:hypothetical protein